MEAFSPGHGWFLIKIVALTTTLKDAIINGCFKVNIYYSSIQPSSVFGTCTPSNWENLSLKIVIGVAKFKLSYWDFFGQWSRLEILISRLVLALGAVSIDCNLLF
jgi:hypothetical protein